MGHADVYELGRVRADLVVLTVLREEYAAVLSCLRAPTLLRGSSATPNTCVWRHGWIDAKHYNVPFSVAVGMGTPTTALGALTASLAIRLFDPRYIVFVGIAGGFDREGQRHGDVAVSSVVTAYEYGKVDTGGFAPRANFTYRCNEALVRASDVAGALGEHWWSDKYNPGSTPSVRTGLIASGDKVIDDPDEAFFAAVQTAWPKILAVEMEGSGVAAAVHEVQGHRAVGFILVRGISDMPHHKAPHAPPSTQERDSWKDVASRNAAHFLAHLVSTAWPVPPRDQSEDPTVASRTTVPMSASRHETAPVPVYTDAESRALIERLSNARVRKQALIDTGLDIDEVNREILIIRRQLREGGQLRAGDDLDDGRYLLIQQVGRGGFSVVWRAYDKVDNREVAIKILHANLAGDPQRRERFFRGAKTMMSIEHPAIVRVLNPHGEDGGFCYFVMELLTGGNLRDAVLQKRINTTNALPLILQVGEALAKAHTNRVIHRDVKPSNILLDAHGNAKLTDFDLVSGHDTTGGTRTGALGTVVYAAPECLDKPQDATSRADVFGLGMTALFCLHGLDLTMSTFRRPEQTINKLSCSPQVKTVLERAVSWEAEERFADVATMLVALRSALHIRDSAPHIARLRCISDHFYGVEISLSQNLQISIGRSEKSHVILNENSVSRHHATISTTSTDIYIEDQNSTNGTFVNGEQVKRQAKIRIDDQIMLGKVLFRLLPTQHNSNTHNVAEKSIQIRASTARQGQDAFDSFEYARELPTTFVTEGLARLEKDRSLDKLLSSPSLPLTISSPIAGRLRELTPADLDIVQLVLEHHRLQKALDQFPGTELEALRSLRKLMELGLILEPGALSSNIASRNQAASASPTGMLEKLQGLDKFHQLESQLPPLTASLRIVTPFTKRLRDHSALGLDTIQRVLDHRRVQLVLASTDSVDSALATATELIRLVQSNVVELHVSP